MTGTAGSFAFLGLRFEQPLWLIGIVLAIIMVLAVAWRSGSVIEPWRWRLSSMLRLSIMVLLMAALSQPRVQWTARDHAVIVIIDDSASVPRSVASQAEEWLRRSAGVDAPPGLRVGVVSAGAAPVIRQLPAPGAEPLFSGVQADPSQTNLEEALRLALTIVPGDAATRLVLASDGNETAGEVERLAPIAAALGIPIDVLPLTYRLEREVVVESLDVPASATPGSEIRLRTLLRSATEAEGVLRIIVAGGSPEQISVPVSLRVGLNEVNTRAVVGDGGPVRARAVFEPARDEAGVSWDTRMENNEATAVTFVTPGRQRILLLTDSTDDARPLVRALQNSDMEVIEASGREAPETLAEWISFDAVVMVDQPIWSFLPQQTRDLASAVHDFGVGLLVVGGPRSFGAGGWQGSPVEGVLPVLLEPKVERQVLRGALVIVIDVSGSMSATVPGANASRIDVACDAAVAALNTLSRQDLVGVIAFAGSHSVVQPLMANSNPSRLATAIRTIRPGGGTNLFPALESAGSMLLQDRGSVRHILVVSDGETMGTVGEGIAIASTLARAGITVSAVGIAEGAGAETLRAISEAGGGNFHPVVGSEGRDAITSIFIQEANFLRRTLIAEVDPFEPAPTGLDPWITEIAPLPALEGYVVTADRGGLAEVTLRGPGGDPIAARWNHGVGRVLCFTSDASPRWASSWVRWPGFDLFWTRQVRWTAKPASRLARLDLATTPGSGLLSVDLGASLGAGEIVDGAVAIIVPQGHAAISLPLAQVSRGHFQGRVELPEAPLHLVAVRWRTGGTTHSAQAAFTARANREHRSFQDDSIPLLRVAEATGGRSLSLSQEPSPLFVPTGIAPVTRDRVIWPLLAMIAALLLVVDVAVRRLHFDGSMVDTASSMVTPTRTAAPLALRLAALQRRRAASNDPK
ncbi:MAG: VWA domain-containing protein [Phycisphaeraceae bacterium]|nr:VWA domain-containing protein [Phycisphaeraceae bacterium]